LKSIFRSVDQFANLVLHRCIERIHVGQEFGDIPRGVFIVRGENVVSLTSSPWLSFYKLQR
jgi:U6 snRNA-associated Sm-like protein LSm1